MLTTYTNGVNSSNILADKVFGIRNAVLFLAVFIDSACDFGC
jgi:hypothetical protein